MPYPKAEGRAMPSQGAPGIESPGKQPLDSRRAAGATNARACPTGRDPEAAYDSIDGLGLDPVLQTPLAIALSYAKAGRRIFPVSADKRPMTAHGFKDATTDEATIRAWWRKWPHAEIGWAVPNEILVIDLDAKHSDIAAFEEREGRALAAIDTPTAATPSGGRHLFFRANGHHYRNGVRVADCCDFRTEGGYVVLPGANNGRKWLKPLDGPWANAPDWLPTAGKRRAKAASVSKGANSAGVDVDDPAVLAFLDEACAAIVAAKNGEQEVTLHRGCYAVGGLVGAGRLREETAFGRLLDAANAMPAYSEPWWGDLTEKVRTSLARGTEQPWSPRPVIEIAGGALAREADEAEHALASAGLPIFTRNFTLVRPVTEEAPASHNRRTRVTILKPVNVDVTIDWLSRYAEFKKWDGRSKKMVTVDPPAPVARIVFTRANAAMFSQIAGVITTPTLRPDGSILEQEGYDAAARLFLTLDREFKLPPVADKPTRDDARAALDLLRGLIAEFPFAGENEDRAINQAVALSGIMTAVLRGALPTAPMHVFRANAAGTGKSLLVDSAAAVATGRLCPVIAAGRSEEETEKRLGALLKEGAAIISLDNVNGELGGDALAQLTERPLVRVRVLGLSEAPAFECKSTVFATGNNTVVVGDMTRRVLFCTLDAKCERPELREFSFNPVERILADRGKYVAACLTIARAYEAAGSPRPPNMKPIGSYEEWSRRVRAPLVWLGEADPVESMERAREEDPELARLRNMMTAWSGAIGIGYRYARRLREVIELAVDGVDLGKLARPELHDALAAVALRGRELNADGLSKWLRGRRGQIVGDLRFASKRDDAGGALWWLEQMDRTKPSDAPF